jgi:hypothetical protein
LSPRLFYRHIRKLRAISFYLARHKSQLDSRSSSSYKEVICLVLSLLTNPLWGVESFSEANSRSASPDTSEFFGTQASILCSEEATAYPYSEPDEFSPHPLKLFQRYISTLSSFHFLDLQSGLFPSGCPTKEMYTFFFSPFVLRAQPISFPLF